MTRKTITAIFVAILFLGIDGPRFHSIHDENKAIGFSGIAFAPTASAQEAACSERKDDLVGNAMFDVCERHPYNTNIWGNGSELYLKCNSNGRPEKVGMKWHLWCNGDGSRCGCNKNEFTANSPSTCCNWKAGDHCGLPGGAPGANGCATWTDTGH
jgi:hypothetical protein